MCTIANGTFWPHAQGIFRPVRRLLPSIGIPMKESSELVKCAERRWEHGEASDGLLSRRTGKPTWARTPTCSPATSNTSIPSMTENPPLGSSVVAQFMLWSFFSVVLADSPLVRLLQERRYAPGMPETSSLATRRWHHVVRGAPLAPEPPG